MSVLAMLTLGATLVVTISSVLQRQALRDGVDAAQTVAVYAGRAVDAESFTLALLDPAQRARLEDELAGYEGRLVSLRLWTFDGNLLYDSESASTGFADGDRLDAATRQARPDARVVTDVRGGTLGGTQREVLSVYTPMSVDGQIVGAAEVVLDHTATTAALRDGSRTVTVVVAAGLVILWLLLFRTVLTASRRLQTSALDNARLALLDSLTGLPNRRLLADRLARSIERAHEDGTRVGLVLLDVDRFKDINDSLGHDRGDELLEQVAARLRDVLRDEDLVARLGGDEFAVLLPEVHSIEDAERLAQRVRGVFAAPFVLGELPLHVETSIGVACLPDHADDATSLMRMADVAMYTAKAHRLGVAVYSPDEDDSSPARLVLLGDLHRALGARSTGRSGARGAPSSGGAGAGAGGDVVDGPAELELHYQPKVDLRTGLTAGYEALIRWRHPTRGLLPPDLFVPLAEQSGLIHELTRFALTTVVAQLALWQSQGRTTPVAVNLSAHDVTSPTVVLLIEDLLLEHDVPAALLEVEITETALVTEPSRIVPVLERLSALGVQVAIDDFGIGNTSISQLLDLPVDQLKIDRRFVTGLTATSLASSGRGSGVVVKAMVDLAHSFGLTVVAEGVEDAATADMLRSLDVDQAQGYHYAQALPADELPDPASTSVSTAVTEVPHPARPVASV
ncbi:EAL domain-containing protein [Cellulomonas cellasea]|uniref:Diguanylate cyclase (GGDEF)-like protein n=1 Tax=Cellulomonas cellasea TaxID=43670 RepID=A0A7W4UIM9_9CELL|nr:EAL domain-containing protein [Cellulomonas cellasea]MBB2924869.1 diguanylate cyclase (GGDEF)-like protein [Cellulomonas cellasea]